jgi:phosphate/sulfate permease
MAGGAVLCINCGYDARTGKSAATASTAAPAKKSVLGYAGKKPVGKKKKDYMAPEGSLVLGVVFSAVFALLASVLWIAIAYFSGYSIGYVAALIGVAAGIGMQAGHKGQSQVGGMIAAAMTLLVILIARLIVLYAIMAKLGVHRSIFDLNSAKLGMYFFSPRGLIFMVIGIAAAYRCASGSMRD